MNTFYPSITKNAILTALLILLTLPVSSSTRQELVLYDLEIKDTESGLIYEDANFTITSTHCSNQVMGGLTVLECLFDNGSRENLKYIGLYDAEVNNTIDGGKSHIDIRYKGSGELYHISFVGFGDGSAASSDTKLYIGPNTIDSQAYYSGSGYSLQDGSFVDKSMAFYVNIDGYEGLDYACLNTSTRYHIPDTISTIVVPPVPPVITDYPDIRKTIKDVRLEWTSSKYASVTKIMGIKLDYTADSSVGLEKEYEAESGPSTRYQVIITREMDGSYRLSRESDIQIYDLSGRLILQKSQAESFDLSTHPEGVYIVTGTDLNTNRSFQEKLVR